MSDIQESQKTTLMNYQQASNLLGVHEVTLRRLVSKKKIPFFKISKSVRFDSTDLLAYFRQEARS